MSTQIPFTRGSGYLIDAALYVVGLERKDVFMSNVLHCHPPHNRMSFEHEIRYCKPYLIAELELVKPQLVIVLGKDAERVLKASTVLIDAKFLYVKHPAYLIRKGYSGTKDWVIKVAQEMEKALS